MNKYFLAVYDNDDFPYINFESYKEAAKFFNTSVDSIRCNVSRKQKKKYNGELYMLYKIYLTKDDPELEKGIPNLHIGALLEVLNI